jgi:GNAT superfamily N-acetyltransferase
MVEPVPTVRLGTRADDVMLAELGARTFAQTYEATNSPDDVAAFLAATYSCSLQARELDDPALVFLIVELDGTPVAYSLLRRGPAPAVVPGDDPIEIVRIYADAAWIGKGVGSALMAACLRRAASQSCDTIWLGVWEQNVAAVRFYERWAFRVVGDKEFVLGGDVQRDIVMCRAVSDPAPLVVRTEAAWLTKDDVTEIVRLRSRAADYFDEVGDGPPSSESFQADLDDLPQGFTRHDEMIYRAYGEGRLAGYAEVLRGYAQPDQWMIGIVLVESRRRGRGIGKAIVAAIVADARAAGTRSLAAGVIAARTRSMAFWRREGFTTEALRRPIVVSGMQTEVVRLVRRLDEV